MAYAHGVRKLAAAFVVCAVATVAACSGEDETPAASSDAGSDVEAPDTSPVEDAGNYAPTGPTVTVTTRDALGALTSATWVAVETGRGAFEPIFPSTTGTYTFGAPGPWSIAIACAAPDNAQSTVAIHRRMASVRSLDVVLDPWCMPAPAFDVVVSGTITNVSPETTWLDFGYPLEGRGNAVVVSGTTAQYELVNVARGTWDVAFGVRDVFTAPFTKVIVRRAEVIAADKTLSIDASKGVALGQKALVVHGADACDTLDPVVRYTMMGGPSGIDVGPQDVPMGPDVALAYLTMPATLQAPQDRYRGNVACLADRERTRRASRIELHDAVDIDVRFLPLLEAPTAKSVASMPYWRVEAKGKRLANVATHEVVIRVEKGQRRDQRWSYSDDEPSGDFAWTLPDLTNVSGFDVAWGLPTDTTAAITLTATEAPSKLGDGAVTRTSAKTIRLDP